MADYNQALPAGTKLQSSKRIYTVESSLGQGGFGITYLASSVMHVDQIAIEFKVAVKELFLSDISERQPGSMHISVMKSMTNRVAASRKDFISEAKRLEKVCGLCRNIVKVSEVFEANNTAYYIMEYLDGESLGHYIKRRGRLSVDEAVALIAPIAQALRLLHDNRMTHLDVKPENIMLAREKDGSLRPVLIDFGLAKHYDDNGNATSTINVVGLTEGYAPMEQYMGITTFSPSADVYALAATLYHALTGNAPAKAGNINFQTVADDLDAVGTPLSLRDLILRSLSPFAPQRPLLTDPSWALLSQPMTGAAASAATTPAWAPCSATAGNPAWAPCSATAGNPAWDPSSTTAGNPTVVDSNAKPFTPGLCPGSASSPASAPGSAPTLPAAGINGSARSLRGLWIGVALVSILLMVAATAIFWPRSAGESAPVRDSFAVAIDTTAVEAATVEAATIEAATAPQEITPPPTPSASSVSTSAPSQSQSSQSSQQSQSVPQSSQNSHSQASLPLEPHEPGCVTLKNF